MTQPEALEGRIADALAAGDRAAAATEGIRGYGRELLRYLGSLLGDEDAFAETCAKIWRGLADFRSDSSFRTRAYRIAWNTSRDHARDARRRHQRVRRLDTAEAEELAEKISRSLGRTSPDVRLARIAARLDLEERSLLLLRVERRLSWKDIARVLSDAGDPVDDVAVRKRFDRLKKKIRKLADERLASG